MGCRSDSRTHRKPASIIRAIEDGVYQPSMKARMAELEAEKMALEERLAAPEQPKVGLHPNLAGVCRQKVAALEQALADPEIKAEAAEIMRGLIGQITLTPDEDGGLAVMLHGDLARILQLGEAGEGKSERPRTDVSGRELSLVAEARYGRCFPLVSARDLERTMPFQPHAKVGSASLPATRRGQRSGCP
jgi:site-specific DNA recombinase